MKLTIELTLVPDADPNEAAEAVFEFLASVGENAEAVGRFDALVESVDGYDCRLS